MCQGPTTEARPERSQKGGKLQKALTISRHELVLKCWFRAYHGRCTAGICDRDGGCLAQQGHQIRIDAQPLAFNIHSMHQKLSAALGKVLYGIQTSLVRIAVTIGWSVVMQLHSSAAETMQSRLHAA